MEWCCIWQVVFDVWYLSSQKLWKNFVCGFVKKKKKIKFCEKKNFVCVLVWLEGDWYGFWVVFILGCLVFSKLVCMVDDVQVYR